MKKTKVDDLKRIELEEFKKTKTRDVIIILDNLRSLNNVGSVFRTCDAFLIKKIYLVGITGSPPNKDIERTALGATKSIEWEQVSCISKIEKKLKEDNWKIALIEQTDKSTDLKDFFPKTKEKYAFVFGKEVFVGLTGDHWTDRSLKPLAWRLRLIDDQGITLGSSQSFLWSK